MSRKQGFKWYETDFLEARDGKIVAYHNLESMRQNLGIPGHISDIDAATFLRQKIRTLVYTVNETGVAHRYLSRGAAGIYTDFISPESIRAVTNKYEKQPTSASRSRIPYPLAISGSRIDNR
ncbi:protein of unknown function [Georgfuchsia toluolica]|uniref:GP-PDE domain-containing protein n=1 Tax=Georgfuchsia toluolica TaxID=424218 RepID=A0A916N0C4_9PROT|nr:hypothetical protein [Georgfuchsia toluolica]CAG4883778.1 protein of unknown function [Georgfuchsia toluolica]